MKTLSSEKITLVLLLGVPVLVSFVTLAGSSVTRQEAIEIGRNSDLVSSLLEHADRYSLKVYYRNRTQANRDHGVWTITWCIHQKGDPSGAAASVSQAIDEETGEILDEGFLVHR